MNPKQRQKIGQRIEGRTRTSTGSAWVTWPTRRARFPVPVTGNEPGIDTVLESSLLVEAELPEGSNWDGKTGLLVDEKNLQRPGQRQESGAARCVPRLAGCCARLAGRRVGARGHPLTHEPLPA